MLRSNLVVRRDQNTVRLARLAATPSESLTGPVNPANGKAGVNDPATGVWKRYGRVGFDKWPLTVSGRTSY